MKNYRILAVCGAGLATSTHVAKTLQTGLKERGIDGQIRTCSVAEATGIISGYQPDVILATVATDSIKGSGDIKVFSGIPLLTGIGSDQILDEVAAYLRGDK